LLPALTGGVLLAALPAGAVAGGFSGPLPVLGRTFIAPPVQGMVRVALPGGGPPTSGAGAAGRCEAQPFPAPALPGQGPTAPDPLGPGHVKKP
jgi:hypothetical protein